MILFKDFVAVFGGGHHRGDLEKLTDVYFFDLRKADKLYRQEKPLKNVWVRREIPFDAEDRAYSDLQHGRIHFSLAKQYNGKPRVYISGGLTSINGQEKLVDSIYEFNIHANNGEVYRDGNNKVEKFKKIVRIFDPRNEKIEMRVRRIGSLQSPTNYHDSDMCEENAVLYFYGGTELKERLGPSTEPNKHRVSYIQTLR